MTIICEQCGRQYNIDPKQIKGKQAMITCESCNTTIIIPNVPEKTPRQSQKVANPEPSKAETWQPATSPSKKMGIGLRGKMFFLFFFVPICLIVAGGFLYLNYMKNLSGLITQESEQIVTNMAEQAIAEKGRSVAKEIERYMLTHPELKRILLSQKRIIKTILNSQALQFRRWDKQDIHVWLPNILNVNRSVNSGPIR